jgi:hypothetical protein
MSRYPQDYIVLYVFTEGDLRDMLDTLGNEEYPIAKSLTHGEIKELGEWVTSFFSGEAVQDGLDVVMRMFLEEVQGRAERGQR